MKLDSYGPRLRGSRCQFLRKYVNPSLVLAPEVSYISPERHKSAEYVQAVVEFCDAVAVPAYQSVLLQLVSPMATRPVPHEDDQSEKVTPKLPTLLLVDDDVATTQSFSKMLELEGYSAVTANDAEAGLAMVEQYAPDAILLDLRIPEADDGLSFLQRLRARGCQMPVAIVTGDYWIDGDLARQLKALNAELWFKPVWLEDLRALVASLIQGSKRVARPQTH